MLAIFAFFSDIPLYIAALGEQLFGADFSAFIDAFNSGLAQLFEAVDIFFANV